MDIVFKEKKDKVESFSDRFFPVQAISGGKEGIFHQKIF